MAELKTKPTKESVEKFINSIADEQRRKDCFRVAAMMKAATKADPTMWGPGIVGFGDYRYKYDSGRTGDWFKVGFANRKDALTLYLMGGLTRHKSLLAKLGKYKTGKGCLYIRRLDDVDVATLKQLINETVAGLAAK